MNKKFTYIDLFAGAGGLSEGFLNENYIPVAHVEKNPNACNTLITRIAYHYLAKNNNLEIYNQYLRKEISRIELLEHIPFELKNSVINQEISEESFEEITTKIIPQNVDLIIGGPPCQAYSIVGRARIREESKKESDPRRFLFRQYIRFLIKYQPKIFVFENVPGILNTKDIDGILFIEKIKNELRDIGYEIELKTLDASEFGVLQRRYRVIIIGWKAEYNLQYPDFSSKTIDNKDRLVKSDILDDLPKLQAGENWDNFSYADNPTEYLIKSGIRNTDDILTWHNARFTNDNDKEIYRRTILKWYNESKRLHYNELPDELKKQKNQKSFLNRFSVVEGNQAFAHTMVAHIAIDGHYYIHPDINQTRSITVREAARIQSFPDSYFFEGSRSSAYEQIGNAVPPIFAQVIAKQIKKMLCKINSFPQ